MAEQGAYITSATSGASKPSIFEVLAQESLMGAVRPALRHAVRVLGETKPAQFGWLYRYYEEAYTVLDLVLQNYFLNKYGGSFSENFYGLKRVATDSNTPSSPRLPTICHRKSLLTLILLPYIKQKLDHKFEEIQASGNSVNTQTASTPSSIFNIIYPSFHTLWEGTLLCYQLAYVLGKGRHHSPFLHFSGVELITESLEELQDQLSSQSAVSRKCGIGGFFLRLLNVLAVTLSTGLSVGVFFLQFMDWWYASDKNSSSLTALPVPPPPQKLKIPSAAAEGICPLCRRSRTNDTALSVSGYVFCYPCIYRYVNQNGCCPVTSYPCRTEHLVKLYLTNS